MTTCDPTTLCIIQRVEYNYPARCERCRTWEEPGTPMLIMICSCGCGAIKQSCLRCPLGYIPACVGKMLCQPSGISRLQEKKLWEKENAGGKKDYVERRFMGVSEPDIEE